MSVQEQITSDIKDAMKARNVDKLAALRAVKSAIMLEATKDGSSLVSDEVSLKIITKLVKTDLKASPMSIIFRPIT
jgi:uncharacterized protein YqeY